MVMIARLETRSWNPLAAASKVHVLLLDESQGSRAETRRILSQGGITKISEGSVNGRHLIARDCDPSSINVILSEMDLRGGWGLDLLKRIRMGQIGTIRPDICFIFMTSATESPLVVTAAHLDANGYLSKPISADKLRMAILRGQSRPCLVDIAKYRDVPIGMGAPVIH